jgi:hypothetical protein
VLIIVLVVLVGSAKIGFRATGADRDFSARRLVFAPGRGAIVICPRLMRWRGLVYFLYPGAPVRERRGFFVLRFFRQAE